MGDHWTRRLEAERLLMSKWLPPGLAPEPAERTYDLDPPIAAAHLGGPGPWWGSPSSSLAPPAAPLAPAGLTLSPAPVPRHATCKSLVEQCVAFIACDFEFCLRAKLVLPDHLYNRVLHHTFVSKLT